MKLSTTSLLILSSLPVVSLGGFIFQPEMLKEEKEDDYRLLRSHSIRSGSGVCNLKDPNPNYQCGPFLFNGDEFPMVCDFPVKFACCVRTGPYKFPLTSLKCDTEKDSLGIGGPSTILFQQH